MCSQFVVCPEDADILRPLYRLISASVGTVVYYGFQCRPAERDAFLVLCFLVGLSGSIVPFTNWFNQREYKASPLLLSPNSHSYPLTRANPPPTERAHCVLPLARVQQHRPAYPTRAAALPKRDVRVHLPDRAVARVLYRRARVLRDALPRVRARAALAGRALLARLAGRRLARDLARVHRARDTAAQAGHGGHEGGYWGDVRCRCCRVVSGGRSVAV